MSDWTAGYVADIGYTYGYYSELNPARVKLAFLNAGLAFPEIGAACELGFGQGVSTNIHAAASVTQWHGTDFNPSQAAFAQDMARSAGSGAQLHDQAFAEFAERSDLPDFDYIGLHGIFSWISDENRAIIVDFIRRKLKVGGVLYISYNTMPGWAAFAPLRHLMKEHTRAMTADGSGVIAQVDAAVNFLEKIRGTHPGYLKANPQLGPRVEKLKDQNRAYMAHEYFNQDWEPMHFATMAEWLRPAKLQYACSAHYLDHVDPINLTPEQAGFLRDIPDPMFRETVRDYMVNQQFRRDYWVKGIRPLKLFDQSEQIRRTRVMLLADRAKITLKVTGAVGEASMTEQIYMPILEFLADHRPRSIGEVELGVKSAGVQFHQLVQAIMVLAGQGNLVTVQDDAVAHKARKQTDRLNAHIKLLARAGSDVGHLASPVLGGGVAVARFSQLFLLAIDNHRKQPAELARFAWQILTAQNQKLVKDGKTLEMTEENLAELTAQAETFVEKQLPLLTALQIA